MEVQLLYVYIKDIGRCLSDQKFCFNNDFDIDYDLNDKILSINKKFNYYCDLWGERIISTSLVIGENGAGKTTLFDLLASTRDRRQSLFSGNTRLRKSAEYEFGEWFALYHIQDDTFVIEGNSETVVSNIDGIPYGTSTEYSYVMKYDYEKQRGSFQSYIQMYNVENDNKNSLNEKVIILYGTNRKEKGWYNSEPIGNKDDYYVGFTRKYLDSPSVVNLYKFMSEEYKIIESSFAAQSIVCNIVRSDTIESLDLAIKSEVRKAFDLELYNCIAEPLYFKQSNLEMRIHGHDGCEIGGGKWTKKQEYIIKYYEFYIIKNWIDSLSSRKEVEFEHINQIQKCIEDIYNIKFEVDNYVSRINYLESVIKIISDTLVKIFLPGEPNYYAEAVIQFARAIEKIDETYFISSKTISIKIANGFDENVKKLLDTYNSFSPNNENLKNDLHNYINVKFSNLSSGELELINGFANLYTALEIEELNPRFETAIIFLDEPDESFHPEWSRKYIYYLTTFLNSFGKSRKFKYQIIISTHSPFMISDVPKEYITCLKVIKKENGEIERESIKAEFGLMSNFYDIIRNDFFISSPIGEFAKVTFDKILQNINSMEVYDEERVQQLKGVIMGIGEELIKKKLLNYLDKKKLELATPNKREERIAWLEKELRQLKEERDRSDKDR